MLYRCLQCAKEYQYSSVSRKVQAVCAVCEGQLESIAESAPLPPVLVVCKDGEMLDRQFLPPHREASDWVFTIGRGDKNALVLGDPTVSTHHAEIVWADDRYVLRDLDSVNGTAVNEVRIVETELANGDVISLGPFELRFDHADSARKSAGMGISEPGSDPESDVVTSTMRPGQTILLEPDSPGDTWKRASAQIKRSMASYVAMNGRLQTALRATGQLSTLLDEKKLLEGLASEVFELFPAERVAVLLLSLPGRGLRTALARHASGEPLSSEIWISRTLASHVLKEKLALVTRDARLDQRFRSPSIFEHDVRAVLVAPLLYGDQVLGLVWADTRQVADGFSEGDLPIFSGLVQAAAVALTNARLLRRVRMESERHSYLSRYLPPELVQKALAGRSSLDAAAESREVTILFSDLRGFTAQSESMTPESLLSLLNAYFARMVEAIFKNGGTLDKFIGDSIMALWGVPVNRPEAPLLAVRAAVAMQKELGTFNRENHGKGIPELTMGIGINTGDAVVGNIGSHRRMDWTAIGAAVNLASRIESQTGPGDIFVSEETFSRLKGAFQSEELPPVRMKSVSRPIRLYRILGDA